MNLKILKRNEDAYKTLTVKLTILGAKLITANDDISNFFADDAILMEFQTESGEVFKQKLEIGHGENSVLHQIIKSTGLEDVIENISVEMFIDKSCSAVIATKSTWKKAYIVAAF